MGTGTQLNLIRERTLYKLEMVTGFSFLILVLFLAYGYWNPTQPAAFPSSRILICTPGMQTNTNLQEYRKTDTHTYTHTQKTISKNDVKEPNTTSSEYCYHDVQIKKTARDTIPPPATPIRTTGDADMSKRTRFPHSLKLLPKYGGLALVLAPEPVRGDEAAISQTHPLHSHGLCTNK